MSIIESAKNNVNSAVNSALEWNPDPLDLVTGYAAFMGLATLFLAEVQKRPSSRGAAVGFFIIAAAIQAIKRVN